MNAFNVYSHGKWTTHTLEHIYIMCELHQFVVYIDLTLNRYGVLTFLMARRHHETETRTQKNEDSCKRKEKESYYVLWTITPLQISFHSEWFSSKSLFNLILRLPRLMLHGIISNEIDFCDAIIDRCERQNDANCEIAEQSIWARDQI